MLCRRLAGSLGLATSRSRSPSVKPSNDPCQISCPRPDEGRSSPGAAAVGGLALNTSLVPKPVRATIVRTSLLVSACLVAYPSVAQPANPPAFEIFPVASYLSSAGDSFSALVVDTSNGSIFSCIGIANLSSLALRLECNKVKPTQGRSLPPRQHLVMSPTQPPTFSGGANGIWTVDQTNWIIWFCVTSGTSEEFASRYACTSKELPS